jgi:hypothetical protein
MRGAKSGKPCCFIGDARQDRSVSFGVKQIGLPGQRSSAGSTITAGDTGDPHHELHRLDLRLPHRAPPDDGGERRLHLAAARGAGGPCACASMLMGRTASVGMRGEALPRADRTID